MGKKKKKKKKQQRYWFVFHKKLKIASYLFKNVFGYNKVKKKKKVFG